MRSPAAPRIASCCSLILFWILSRKRFLRMSIARWSLTTFCRRDDLATLMVATSVEIRTSVVSFVSKSQWQLEVVYFVRLSAQYVVHLLVIGNMRCIVSVRTKTKCTQATPLRTEQYQRVVLSTALLDVTLNCSSCEAMSNRLRRRPIFNEYNNRHRLQLQRFSYPHLENRRMEHLFWTAPEIVARLGTILLQPS